MDNFASSDTPHSDNHTQPKYDLGQLYLDLEERINPSILQYLELNWPYGRRGSEQAERTLPETRRLAWFRYVGLSIYRRLFSVVVVSNLIAIIYILNKNRDPNDLVNAAAANLLALGLARQPLVVNALFLTFGSLPRSAPFWLRRLAAKIYCYGGIHSGCGVAAFIWYTSFVGILTHQKVHEVHDNRARVTPIVLGLAWMIESLLFVIIVAAYPTIRFKLHDYFELIHRFCSWAVIILFWLLLGLLAEIYTASHQHSTIGYLARLPAFWMLIIVTLAIIHPWVLLRRVRTEVEPLSSHSTRLHFAYTTIDFGQGLSLARSPLRDWHSFATFPDSPSTSARGTTKANPKFSCLISKAGDWTGRVIAEQPTHLWKRGVPVYGFGYVIKLFRRLVLVTTGSGIGPCLSIMGDPNRPSLRVVWQTRTPQKTYGEKIIALVKAMDPDPIIIDTSDTGGRVDMLSLVLQLHREFEAEAVAIISNPIVTKSLVWECESRGIAAFGPIFDS